jgi:hypothetical protein
MKRWYCLSLCLTLFVSVGYARQDKSDSQSVAAISQITEGRVTATISFLASDELAGRATASPEFDIAAAYVASRFRGAGLVGGADGGFYHETSKRMVQIPSAPLTITNADNFPIQHFGLLACNSEPFKYSGELVAIDLSADLPTTGLSGFVGGVYQGDAKGPRLISQVIRIAGKLSEAGAKMLLLGVAPDSELIQLAQQSRDKPRPESPQNRFAIPVLLVPVSSLDSKSLKLEVPATIVMDKPMRNVIGMLAGTDPELSKEAILFSAHLDHLGVRTGVGDVIYNGADDDASGVTAVVMLADAFGAMPRPKRTLLFMAFWGEESGLLGSKQFVANPSWPLEKMVANINIEMIGRPEPGANGKIWMTGWQESNLGSLMNSASILRGTEIFEHPSFSSRFYRASDNWSFAEKGVIAHSFSAGSIHADYHQPDDEWERLEIPHMTRVIQGLFYASQPLVQGTATPISSKRGR